MLHPNPYLIPVRRPISPLIVDGIAQSTFDRLVSGWGLVNVKKIVGALQVKVKAEAKRRKKLESK